ncbi:hypothetical protein GCM10010466_28770 [Planomonospora alba]|uniref:Uncharacterized protein n=1 Tax=Planomonospora alba TaxID=161354 RepID=A0ABP6N4I8_9ACTN
MPEPAEQGDGGAGEGEEGDDGGGDRGRDDGAHGHEHPSRARGPRTPGAEHGCREIRCAAVSGGPGRRPGGACPPGGAGQTVTTRLNASA